MKISKKALSLLLAVIMVITSISVCFGSISFAAGGTPTEKQWNDLASALANDSIMNATFSGSANNYTVTDPDGKVLAAVNAYWSVLDTLANKAPGCGSPDNTNTSYTTYQSGANRTINQVIASIKTEMSSRMGANYTNNVASFLDKLACGVTVSAGYGTEQNKGGMWNDDKTVPSSNLNAIAAINLKVDSKGITEYTIDNLPDTIYADKTFTVNHTNTNYDYKYSKTGGKYTPTYKRYYKFFYNISGVSADGGAATSTSAIKAANTVFSSNSYYNAANVAAVLALSKDKTTLENAKATLAAEKTKVVNANGAAIFTHFFGTKYNAAISNIDNAITVLGYEPTVNQINAYYSTDFSRMNKAEVKTLLDNFSATYKTFTDLTSETRAIIVSTYGLDTAAVEARIEEISDRYDALCIIDYKATAELHVNEYEKWTVDDIDNGNVTAAMITAAVATLNVDIQNLEGYDAAFVAAVAGEGYVDSLKALKASLQELGVIAGYNEEFLAEYAEFAADIRDITTKDYEDLYTSLTNYDKWYTDLKALINEMRTELGDEIADKLFDDLNTLMVDHMNAAYDTLKTTVETQINVAYDLFTAYLKTHEATGNKIIMATVSEYNAMKNSIGLIDVDAMNFLNGTADYKLSAETNAKYQAMLRDFPEYQTFLDSHGFSTFETNEIADIERPDTEDDIARENENGIYKVTDAQVEKVIELLDAALGNEEVQNLLGQLINKDEDGNPTGEPFKLGDLVNGLLEDVVYTDSLVNTIIQFVYPIVAKEFAKVWAGLPDSITIPQVGTGMSWPIVGGEIKADVKADLYLNDVETSIAAVGVFLSPATLAKNLQNQYGANSGEYAKYTQVISTLNAVTTKAVYNKGANADSEDDDTFTNPWEDPALFKNVYDEETGEQVFNDDGTPKQVYKLEWGIDEAEDKRAAFVDAMCAACSGLEHLLYAILTNQYMANANDSDADPRGHKIGTGSGKAEVSIAKLNLTIDPITLVLSFSANDGWDNALVPIFEALGLENIPHSEDMKTTRQFLEKGLLAMIDQLIDRLNTDPVTFILEALPNLCFALEGGLVKPLLNMLKTDINYYADAQYHVDIIGGMGVDGKMKEAMKSEEPIKINIGEMIKLEDMGLDIGSFQAIWNMIAGGVELLKGVPAPNAGYIATLGKLVEKDTNRSAKTYNYGASNKAAYIEANKADVLLYLINYVLTSGLLSKFELPSEGFVADLIANLLANPDNIIAAIVEILTLGEYDTLENYTWYEGDIKDDGSTVTGLTPAMIEYLAYDNDWTKEKATYIVENVNTIIAAVLNLVNKDKAEDEIVSFDLGAMIGDAIGGALTNETLTELAKLLAMLSDINGLIANAGKTEETPDANKPETVEEGEEAEEEAAALDIDVDALINAFIGLDFSSYAEYAELGEEDVYDFGVTDLESFANALVELLAPLKSVLDFILAGADIEIALSDKDKVTLVGYNGYDSAIVPLLEALGCEVEALGENDDALALILEALVGKINAIVADPINEILDTLPGVIYFIQSNGLATAVRNLLQPVYVVLDTIRPIFDVNIAELLANIEINEQPLSINLDDLGWNFIINDLLPNFLNLDLDDFATLIADVCKVIGVEYDSASSVVGKGKKGAYNETFDKADLVTVVLSFALEWIQKDGNADDLAALIAGDDAAKEAEIKKYINGAFAVISGIDPQYDTINWAYNFPDGFDESIFDGGLDIAPTIESLTYPTDWTEETAKYISDNLDAIVTEVLKLAKIEGTLSDLLKANINIFNAKTLNDLVALIADLLVEIDDVLIETVGVALGVDIDAITSYVASEEIDTAEEFFAALADVLSNIQRVIDWLFFGKDFTLLNTSAGADAIVLKGTEGYAYGLAPILEALGVAAPEVIYDEVKNGDETEYVLNGEETVEAVFAAIATRYNAIIGDPVNQIFEILPNVIYFLNANGVSISLKNLLAGVTGLTAAIEENFGVEVDLFAIINDAINKALAEKNVTIDVTNMDLEAIIALVEALTGLDLTVASEMLVDFCVGKIVPFTSVSGEYGFKMIYNDDFARYDMITILVTVALMLVDNDKNEAALNEMLGQEIIGAIRDIFAGGTPEYSEINWNYPLAENGTVDAMKYSITYPTNWTEDTAKYVTSTLLSEEFDALVAGLIDSNYSTLGELLNAKVNVFTTENLNALVGTITDLLGDISDELLGVGMIVGADIPGLKAYNAPEGIATVDAFAAELANILTTYAPGVVEWLLLGRDFKFFVDERKMADGVIYDAEKAIITISGADGYTEGLALLLEALGCENLPTEGSTEEIVAGVLASLATRIQAILDNPVVEVFELLPNLLYFLNTNGVATVVDNTIAALMIIVNKLGAFGVNLDINEFVNLKKLMKIEDTDATISIDNLSMADILQAVSYMTGLDLTYIKDVLVGFALGEVKEYDSISSKVGTPKKMSYKTDFDKHDMVTVLANLVLITLADKANEDFVKGLVGEDIYAVILNIFNFKEADIQKFDWKLTDKVGQTFSALNTSEIYAGHEYGPQYTEEMAQYIADNFGEFADNIVYLLGIEINGETVNDVKDLINGLLNGSVYNSSNVVAIRDALAGILAGIADLEVKGANVGKYIVEILKAADIAELDAVATVEVPEFTENREMFVEYLCKVLAPLDDVLAYVLADKDITFFTSLDKIENRDAYAAAVSLKGAEGYRYGIIPLLEALGCDEDAILGYEEYYAAVEKDSAVLLTSILNPLLDRVDEILADDPAQEILDMLPNIIYFINSNGVDTVVKNTLNAVYSLLNAIEPIAKIDLYELIGIDLAEINFEWLFNKALELIADATGYEFAALDANAILELTVGTLEKYDSKSGLEAYRMTYAAEGAEVGGKSDMVTVVLRLLVTFIMHENNQEMLLGLLRDNFGMTADVELYVGALLSAIAKSSVETQLGMDAALSILYYVFYGADLGVDNATNGVKDLNAEWTKLLSEMRNSKDEGEALAGEIIAGILDLDIFDDIVDPEEGIAPNGFIKFIMKIIEFFKKLFSWGK